MIRGEFHWYDCMLNLSLAGLSIHPVRPFLLASCSRDSTMRLWSLASFVAPLYLKVLAGKPDDEIIRVNGEYNVVVFVKSILSKGDYTYLGGR